MTCGFWKTSAVVEIQDRRRALRIKDDVLPGVPVNRQARQALAQVFERDLGYER